MDDVFHVCLNRSIFPNHFTGGGGANSTNICEETRPPQDLVNIVTGLDRLLLSFAIN